jgi:hypothetical protein
MTPKFTLKKAFHYWKVLFQIGNDISDHDGDIHRIYVFFHRIYEDIPRNCELIHYNCDIIYHKCELIHFTTIFPKKNLYNLAIYKGTNFV